MTDWQSPKVNPPPQGVKILWFKSGDVFIAQRLADKYISLQPGEATILEEPKLWAICPVPAPYQGMMGLKIDGEMMNIDEAEKRFPDVYKQFIASIPIEGFKFK